jgi:hypothetical protein
MRRLSLEEKEKIARNLLIKTSSTQFSCPGSVDDYSSHIVDSCLNLLNRSANNIEILNNRLNEFENRLNEFEKRSDVFERILKPPTCTFLLKRIVKYVWLLLIQE